MGCGDEYMASATYAAAPARYALERRRWDEASELQLVREDFAWGKFGWAQSIHYFARGIGAARSGHPGKARQELATIKKLYEELPGTTLPYWREDVQVHIDAVASWILFAEGHEDEALQRALAAADREDAVDKHPVTPGEVLPARELYADMLMEAGMYAKSLERYRIVLSGSPNRLNALLGAAGVSFPR
jgi:tetratricopeptide (TPR) repeat protein